MARDVTLTATVQIELDNVIQKNTAAMNEEQLRTHIQEVNTGLVALSQLPTTSRLQELLEAKRSVKDAEARASTSDKELALTQQRLKELEQKTPECDHEEMEGRIRGLEQQLAERAPNQVEMARDLEDAQAQLEVMRRSAEEYREQVT